MSKSGSGFPNPSSAVLAGLAALALLGCEAPAKPPPEPSGPIPWTAAIGRLDAQGDTSCTATLVEPDLIVTAAHCLFPRGRQVSPAELVFTPNVGAQRLPTVRVTQIVGLGVDKMDPEKPEDTPTEVDWAILRLAAPVANVTPIPVEPVALADIERRIKAGDDVLSNLGYGTYGITISRRLHRSEGCTLIPEWRELAKGTDDRLVVTTCPVIKGDSGGPILLTDKAQNRRLIAVVSGYYRREESESVISLAVGARAFAEKLQ